MLVTVCPRAKAARANSGFGVLANPALTILKVLAIMIAVNPRGTWKRRIEDIRFLSSLSILSLKKDVDPMAIFPAV